MDCTILIKFALLATFGCQAAGKLIVRPRDTDVKGNHSTYFNCSTDHGLRAIFWYHGTKHVYTGNAILEPYHERFRVDRDERNGTYIYNLVIHSVQPGDAGQYKCAEDEGVGEEYSVQLTVLDDDPICRSNVELDEVIGQNTCNIEPDKVELECSVTYHGNIPPQLEWTKAGENSTTPLEVSVVTSRNHIVSTLKLKGDIALNNSSYVCETKRTTQEPIKCTSEIIKILYAVSGNSATNKIINDKIHCNANTSQSCSYKWKWLQDNDFTIESSTSVLIAKKPGWHRCEAECYLRNQTCNLLVMRAMVNGTTDSSHQTRNIIISVVVTVVVTLIVAFVVIFVWANCCEETDEEAEENEDTDEQLQTDRKQLETEHLKLDRRPTQADLAIYGLAVLGHEVFISRLQRPDIEVYDSTHFHFKRRMAVEGMTNPEHIVSCRANICIYAFDWGFHNQFSAILRIDPTNGNLIKTWIIDGSGGQLSIASDTNVILNINYAAKLHEYTADGVLIRKINLSSGAGIIHVRHALKLNNGQFVVCQGDPINQVCLLSIKANNGTPGRTDEVHILKTFGGEHGKSKRILEGPMYLSVDKEGSILVSDASRKTVLLSSKLDKPQIIDSGKHGLSSSGGTCFDESTGQWFVAYYTRVVVCRVKGKQIERKTYDIISQ